MPPGGYGGSHAAAPWFGTSYGYAGYGYGGNGGNGRRRATSVWTPPQALVAEVANAIQFSLNDGKSHALRKELMNYAAEQVRMNLGAIQHHLQHKAFPPGTGVDFLWTPTGYMAIAQGGQFEVVMQLARHGVLKPGRFMGASGGACSGVLAAAGGEISQSSHELLTLYMAYSHLMKTSWAANSGDGQLWNALYHVLLSDQRALGHVATHVSAAANCPPHAATVMQQFQDLSTLAAAVTASGAFDYWYVSPQVGQCIDGAKPTFFRNSENAQLYFQSFFYEHSAFGLETTEEGDWVHLKALYMKGVDETIQMLKSESLNSSNAFLVRASATSSMDAFMHELPWSGFPEWLARDVHFVNMS